MAMTKALRQDPLSLYTQLQARREDLQTALRASVRRKDTERIEKLTAVMAQVDAALEKTVERLNEIAAAEDGLEDEEVVEEEVVEDEPADDDVVFDDDVMDEEAMDEEALEEENEEEAVDEDGSLGPLHSKLADDPGQQHQDALPEEEVVDENPVAMKAGLRRDVGDLTADFLDNYSLAIHTKVLDFFNSLNERALDLGEENADDGETSLRELLRVEVGKRGLSRFEPVFAEWRADLIKKLSKTINEMFALPEEPSAPAVPTSPLLPTPQAPVVSQPEPTVAAVQASGRVSFMVRDFVPSGQRVVAKME